jgi:hypothetical protein
MILALLLLSIVPRDDVARETVDLAELNHHYDEHGRHVWDQVIFYDWGPPYTGPIEPVRLWCQEEEGEPLGPVKNDSWRFQVRTWRLVKNLNIIPQRDWERGGYRSLWQDGEVLRDVQAKAFRETWSQDDPELIERLYLPKAQRKELK